MEGAGQSRPLVPARGGRSADGREEKEGEKGGEGRRRRDPGGAGMRGRDAGRGVRGRDAVREDGGGAATSGSSGGSGGGRGGERLGRRAAALPAAALLGARALHLQYPVLVLLRLCHPALPA